MGIIERILKKVSSVKNFPISSGTERSGAVYLLSEHRHLFEDYTALELGRWLSFPRAEALPFADPIDGPAVDEAESQAVDCFRQNPESSLVVKVTFWRQHLFFDERILGRVLPLQVEAAR